MFRHVPNVTLSHCIFRRSSRQRTMETVRGDLVPLPVDVLEDFQAPTRHPVGDSHGRRTAPRLRTLSMFHINVDDDELAQRIWDSGMSR